MKNILCRAIAGAVIVASMCLTGVSTAQTYPSKPITIVVPFSAGAGMDSIARILAEKLAPRIGQPVVVENRTGASGIIGSGFVAKAPADGHTLLLASNSLSFAQLLLKVSPTGSYDGVSDFSPIIEIGRTPVFLVAGAASGFQSFKDAASAAKTKKLNYGSAGTGSINHIIGEAVNKATGVDFVHVPYKGVAPAVADVLGGHIPFAYATYSTIRPYVPSGKLVPLAVTSRERTPLAPNVPSLYELGYKGVDLDSWYGIFGPKNVPPTVIKTLNEHLNEILKMPDVVARMASLGANPRHSQAATT